MALERREVSSCDTPRIGWLWGLLLVAAVAVIGLAVVTMGLAVTGVVLFFR